MKNHITNRLSQGTRLFGVLLLASATAAFAEGPTISGHIESTYMYDFNDPTTQNNPLRSYDATTDSFYLNAAHVAINGNLDEDTSYTVEVDYGSDAKVNNGNDNPNNPNNILFDVDIQEAYLTFPVGPLSLTAGKFVTYEGIEVIEGPANPTISRGYLYGLAEAFGHVGGKVGMPLGEMMDLSVGVVNGRDRDTDNNKGKTVIWRMGFDFGDPLSFGISGSHGQESVNNSTFSALTSIDLTGSTNLIPRFPIMFQVLYAQQDNAKADLNGNNTSLGKWSGFGLQPTLELTDAFSIGMRAEYIDHLDINNYTATNYTVTPTFKVNDAVTVRAEVRRDIVHSTTGPGPFVDDKGMAKGTSTTASLGFSYMFE